MCDYSSTKRVKLANFGTILGCSHYYDDTIETKHLEWLFEAEKTAKFVDWLCTTVSSDNIVQAEEIEQYLTLTTECPGTSDVFLLNETLPEEPPAIEDVSLKTLASLKDEILEVDMYLDVLQTYKQCLRSLKEQHNKELHVPIQGQYEYIQECLKSVEDTSITLSSKLDSSLEETIECVQSLSTAFRNSLLEDQLTCLEGILEKSEKQTSVHIGNSNQLGISEFGIELTPAHIEQSVVINGNKKTSTYTTNQYITRKMKHYLSMRVNYLKKAISEIKYRRVMEDIEKQENLAVIEDVLQLAQIIEAGILLPSQTILRVELATFLDKLNSFGHISFGDILPCIDQFTNVFVLQLFVNLSKKVKHHQTKMLNYYQMLLQFIGSQYYHCYLVFLLMVIKKLKLEDFVRLSHDFSQSLNEDLKQLRLRREKMKVLRVEYDARNGKELCSYHSLPKILALLAPPKTSYLQLFVVFKKFDDSIHKEEFELYESSYHIMRKALHKNIQSVQELEKILYTGATKKPVLVDIDLSCELHDIGTAIKELQDKLKAAIVECEETKFLVSTNSSRYRRLIWVYFLTNYKKIDELIDHMEC